MRSSEFFRGSSRRGIRRIGEQSVATVRERAARIVLNRLGVSASLFFYRTYFSLCGFQPVAVANCPNMPGTTTECKRSGRARYRVPDDVRATHSEDGAILLSVRHGQMFSANRVGSAIFQLLKAGRDEAAILAEISHKFVIGEEVVRSDLRDFVAALTKCHLLEVTDSDTAGSAPDSTICSFNA